MRGGTSTRREIVLKLSERDPFRLDDLDVLERAVCPRPARTVEVGPRGDAL